MKKIQLEPMLKNQSNDAYHNVAFGNRPAALPADAPQRTSQEKAARSDEPG
jgi:hypothetical protein